jgi:hypothetical protein
LYCYYFCKEEKNTKQKYALFSYRALLVYVYYYVEAKGFLKPARQAAASGVAASCGLYVCIGGGMGARGDMMAGGIQCCHIYQTLL